MNAFEYAGPTTLAEATKALTDKPGSIVLAGGTDLLDRIKEGHEAPPRVVYIKKVKELTGIGPGAGNLTIGAATRLADIAKEPAIAQSLPALRQAALEVGSPQIRNMATLGGNLLQRPRDWYFRAGYGLHGQATGHQGHLHRDGDNRYAAIFQTEGDALYAHMSSLAPPLIALDARATLIGPDGERTIAVADLYRVPKGPDESELTLKPGEILTGVTIPAPTGANATYEVRQKQSHDWPLVLCSVALTKDGRARIVLGCVAPIPWRSEAAEKAISGQAITPESAEKAGAAAVAEAKPLSMNAYKVRLAQVAVKRALLAAAGNRYWEA